MLNGNNKKRTRVQQQDNQNSQHKHANEMLKSEGQCLEASSNFSFWIFLQVFTRAKSLKNLYKQLIKNLKRVGPMSQKKSQKGKSLHKLKVGEKVLYFIS